MTGKTGSLRYMAPEVVRSQPYNEKVDIYSFGIILWQMITCQTPFENLQESVFISEVVGNGVRPPFSYQDPGKHTPIDIPVDVVEILQKSWSSDHTQRLIASQLLVLNKNVLANVDKNKPTNSWLSWGRRSI